MRICRYTFYILMLLAYTQAPWIQAQDPAPGEQTGNALSLEEALLQALNSGKVACYVTDFLDEKLLEQDQVIGIPHLGASTPESEANCARMAVDQLMDYLENGNIKYSVNFPGAEMIRNGGYRLCIANKNVPKMVGQITTVLANEDINIANMLNRHKDDIAYNIIDVDEEVTEEQLAKIRGIDGVIKVRLVNP